MTLEQARACEPCGDTGNVPTTGWEHPGFDDLGCPRCNAPDGPRCCNATPRPGQELLRAGMCASCGHPVREVAW